MSTSVLQMPSQTHDPFDARNEVPRAVLGFPIPENAWMAQRQENQPSAPSVLPNFSPRASPLYTGHPFPTNSQQQHWGGYGLTFHGAPFQSTSQPYAFVSGPDASSDITPTGNLSSSSPFTPANATIKTHGADVPSPLHAHFDDKDLKPFYSDISASAKPRIDSVSYPKDEDTLLGTPQSSAGRRRRSEYAEPGSARAIYLEKNRKAASKCRSKQKMEQEALVERSREFERRNRVLKAEVEFLRAELRGIKELVGQHANCPDRRMSQYLQREADRLAAAETMQQYQ